MKTSLCWIMVLAWCAIATARAEDQPTITLPAKEKFHLFLLAGQSNMAGRGVIEDQDRQPPARVLTLTADNRWVPAIDPLHFDKPAAVGVGLGRTFAIELAASDPEVTIGLIPCAVGGSPIASWRPGAFYTPTKSHPYDDAVRRTKLALESGILKGILWHQGESDAARRMTAAVYEERLHELIARMRKEFGTPEVPFIVGQMGQFAERPWSDAKHLVDAAHRRLPEQVPNTSFVSSDGLNHKGDRVHFDAESYRELGRRYAAAFESLKAPSQP